METINFDNVSPVLHSQVQPSLAANACLVEHVVVAVVMLNGSTSAATSVRSRSPVGRAAVVGWAVASTSRARETGVRVVSVDVPGAVVDLPVSSSAGARSMGRAGGVHRAAAQALAVVSVIPLGVLKMSSTRAVAVGLARAGEAGRGATGAAGAVVSNVPSEAGDTTAALVLSGAPVTVAAAVWAATSSTAAGVTAASTTVGATAVVHVGESSASSPAASSATVDLAAAATVSSTTVAVSTVATASGGPASSVPRSAVASAAVVVEAESNPVSLVLQVAPRWVEVGAPRVARSTHVS